MIRISVQCDPVNQWDDSYICCVTSNLCESKRLTRFFLRVVRLLLHHITSRSISRYYHFPLSVAMGVNVFVLVSSSFPKIKTHAHPRFESRTHAQILPQRNKLLQVCHALRGKSQAHRHMQAKWASCNLPAHVRSGIFQVRPSHILVGSSSPNGMLGRMGAEGYVHKPHQTREKCLYI